MVIFCEGGTPVASAADDRLPLVPEAFEVFVEKVCAFGDEELFDVGDHAGQEGSARNGVTEGGAGVAFGGEAFRRKVEGEGDGEFGFVEIGDVQDEGEGRAGVYEAEGGVSTDARDDSVAEGGVGRGQQAIDVVAGSEGVARFVVAFDPGYAGALGVVGVQLADAGSFAAAELLDGETCGVFTRKAQVVHAACDCDTFFGTGDEPGLP